MYKIKICGTNERFTGLQALLTDSKKKLVLDKYGNPGWKSGGECEHFYVPDDDRVSEMEIAYDYKKIVYIGFWTEKGRNIARGSKTQWAQTYTIHFTRKTPLIGFVGYHKRDKKGHDVLSAVGAYKNFCSSKGSIKIDLSMIDGRNSTAGMHMFDPVESAYLTPFDEGGAGVSNAVLLIVIVACTVVLVVPVVICIFLLANNGKKPLFEGVIEKRSNEDIGDTFES